MPMSIVKAKSPKGHEYARMHSSGDVTAADAEALSAQYSPGGPFFDMAILALVDPGAKFSPEARQVFTKTGSAPSGGVAKPVAVVVASAPLRVMLSFIIRMSGAAGSTRFFPNEAEALAFVDQWMDEIKATAA
jgi:hypothetical protein